MESGVISANFKPLPLAYTAFDVKTPELLNAATETLADVCQSVNRADWAAADFTTKPFFVAEAIPTYKVSSSVTSAAPTASILFCISPFIRLPLLDGLALPMYK